MSARQRARLRRQVDAGVDSDNDEVGVAEDEEEEEEYVPVKKSTFVLDSSSSESESSETEMSESTRSSSVVPQPMSRRRGGKAKPVVPSVEELEELAAHAAKLQEERDDAFLQEILNAKAVEIEAEVDFEDARALSSSEAVLHWRLDPKSFDVDHVARVRLAGLHDGPDHRRQDIRNRRNPRGTISNMRKWLFGIPDEDWKKPPALVGGGMGMRRISREFRHSSQQSTTKKDDDEEVYSVFSFIASKEYSDLTQLYRIARNTGDANYLLMILANYPYYAEGFVDLAEIFWRMGKAERAFKTVRRALYIFECASMEAFKPHMGQSRLLFCSGTDSSSAVDGSNIDICHENRVYLRALHLFQRLCATQGFQAVSCNVSLMILALNPSDDITNMLLSLDSQLLLMRRWDVIFQLCGFTPSSSSSAGNEDATALTLPSSAESALQRCWQDAYVIDVDVDDPAMMLTVQALPSWWWSLAVAVYLAACESNNTHAHCTRAAADQLLLRAARRWPQLAVSLVEQIAANDASAQRILAPGSILRKLALRSHSQSSSTSSSGSGSGENDSDELVDQRLSALYLRRGVAVWSRHETVIPWLLTTLSFLSENSNEADLMIMSTGTSRLRHQRYAHVDMDVLQQEGMTADLEGVPVFEAQMVDAALQGQMTFKNLDKHLRSMALHMQQQSSWMQYRRQSAAAAAAAAGAHGFGWVVDLALPLLQLFWLTLLPWMSTPQQVPWARPRRR